MIQTSVTKKTQDIAAIFAVPEKGNGGEAIPLSRAILVTAMTMPTFRKIVMV